MYISEYKSPVGILYLVSDETSLLGLWIEGQKFFLNKVDKQIDKETKILKETKLWLDNYFQGKKPEINIPLNPQGTTFQKQVWDILCTIPYGQTITYKDIANTFSKSMSAQAIGQAVGHNPISIIIPCHRVIGTNKNLTGYAGGIDKKEWLLKHEGFLK